MKQCIIDENRLCTLQRKTDNKYYVGYMKHKYIATGAKNNNN